MDEIGVKKVPALDVVCIRRRGPYREIGPAFSLLLQWINQHDTPVFGPPFAILEDPIGNDPEGNRFAVCFAVAETVAGEGEVKAEQLPACTAATTVQEGPYGSIHEGYHRLAAWLGQHNLVAAGPYREIFWIGPMDRVRPDHYKTEILVPVAPEEGEV